jgi:hypothetical protein
MTSCSAVYLGHIMTSFQISYSRVVWKCTESHDLMQIFPSGRISYWQTCVKDVVPSLLGFNQHTHVACITLYQCINWYCAAYNYQIILEHWWSIELRVQHNTHACAPSQNTQTHTHTHTHTPHTHAELVYNWQKGTNFRELLWSQYLRLTGCTVGPGSLEPQSFESITSLKTILSAVSEIGTVCLMFH